MRASDLPPLDADPVIGRVLDGRFTIVSKLGAGSMGTVYRAKQHAIGRDVAIKILRSDKALDETSKARFLREARANSVLHSPNTVTVFDFGQSESGEFYLAMELLEGESLGQRLARVKRLPANIAVETTRQALRSLAEAHARGIIHRDLKPDNLFYARVLQSDASAHDEIVKVLDFGIAKMLRDDDSAISPVETQAGTVFGTPRYMSPEQAQGKVLDARSDLYSLAVILYQMLTGRAPFTDSDAVIVMARHIKTMPKPPSEVCPEARVPPDIEHVLMRTLSKDPNGRPESADAFSKELARAAEANGAVISGVRTSMPSISPPAPTASATAPMMVTDDDPMPSASLQLNDPSLDLFVPAVRTRRNPAAVVIVAAVTMALAAGGVWMFLDARDRAAHGVTGILLPPRTGSGSNETSGDPSRVKSVSNPPLPSDHEPPSIAAESLPRASQQNAASFPPPAKGPRPNGPHANVAPPPVVTATPQPNSTPPPAPSASSTYGIFE
jgi:serine/threonine protein kinase